MTELVGRVQRLRPVRVWQRFVYARGKLLAAGIAYYGFLSLFPALALAAVVFGLLLRGRPELLAAVEQTINDVVPGVVQTPDNPDGFLVINPPATVTLSITGIVAVITLVFGGLGWVGSMRTGIRAVFGAPGYPGTLVTAKLRDLAVFVLLGVSILVSATLTVLATEVAEWVPQLLGVVDRGWVVTDVSLLVSLLVNTAIVLLLLRVLSGVVLPIRAIRSGVMLGGLGLTLLQVVGGALIAFVTRNPLFGSIVVVVGLLFWLNFTAWVILLSAAWVAGDMADARAAAAVREHEHEHEHKHDDENDGGAEQVPGLAVLTSEGGVDPHSARERAVHGVPTMSSREQDRVSIVAGAVLGATAAVSIGALSRAVGRLLPRRHRF